MELIFVGLIFFGLSYFANLCTKHNQQYTKKTSTPYQPSKTVKKPDNTIFYIIGIGAFLLSMTGVGAIIGMPILWYICRHAFWEADKRNQRYEDEQRKRGY